jgi:hypothetical protein
MLSTRTASSEVSTIDRRLTNESDARSTPVSLGTVAHCRIRWPFDLTIVMTLFVERVHAYASTRMNNRRYFSSSRRGHMRRLILVTCFVAGCAQGALPIDNVDGFTSGDMVLGMNGEPAEGIYAIDVSPATGDCQPPTLSGPLRQQFQAYGGVLSYGALRVTTPMVSPTGSATGFESIDVFGDSAQGHNANVCGATQDFNLIVTGTSDSAYNVVRSDTWSDTADANRAVECLPPVPARDCHTSANMRFTLVQACPSPNCAVRNLASTTLTCVCGDGGAP